jgi:hypothetical protein
VARGAELGGQVAANRASAEDADAQSTPRLKTGEYLGCLTS